MKRKPIEIKHHGCLNCSNIQTKLNEDHKFGDGSGVHFYTMSIDNDSYNLQNTSVREILLRYKEQINNAELVEIKILTPLHDETYELNKDDNVFYLVQQGIGYV